MRSGKTWAAILAATTITGVLTVRQFACAADHDKAPATKPAATKEPSPPAYLDAESAGPDFLVQGEYVGEVTDAAGKQAKLAAQVAALGDGTFQAALLAGGLPGEGWDGKSRVELTGKTADGSTTFAAPGGYAARLAAGRVLLGKTDKGEEFVLRRTERKSPTLGTEPPPGATVLFSGADAEAWVKGHLDERHLLAAGTETVKKFQNFTLHLEFQLPFKPKGKDQDRGNSGVYIQKRYEVQILDSFGQPPVFNGTGALYRQLPPKLNMCLPPLQWQTYDIDFMAAKFDDAGKKARNAIVTVRLNGVIVHDNQEIKDKTGAGQKEGPEPGPIQLQGHGNPVFFRNVWIVEK